MKVSNRQYATALYESLEAAKPAETATAISGFVKLLVKNNDLKRATDVIAEFERLWNERNGVVEVEARSANELGKEAMELVSSFVADTTGAKEVRLKTAVDKELLAGLVLRMGDKVLDGSLKTKIKQLKEEIIK